MRGRGSALFEAGGRRRRPGRIVLPAVVVGAVLVAEAAVWLLRPRDVIEPATVSESQYFGREQIDRARDFRGGQRLLGLGGIAIQGAVLTLLVVRPPRRALRLAERAGRGRPLVGGALLGAGLIVAVGVAPLPLNAAAHQRAVDVGLSTQSWEGWVADLGKATALAAALAAVGAGLFLGLMRRFPRRWWLGGAAAVVLIEILFVWLGPVLLAPLFNRFTELPQGRTRTEVTSLARAAGVDVGDLLVADASKRTRGANAFVTGLGPTKRVVLYDTLLERFTPAQTRLVVAHELGHVKGRDLWRGILWVALVAPIAMYVVSRLTERWGARAGAEGGTPAVLPAFALALALVAFVGGVVSAQLSRRVEARSDTFALELTGEPRVFIEMERELALSNLGDPDPPRLFALLFATHPSTVERIGAALAFERRGPE